MNKNGSAHKMETAPAPRWPLGRLSAAEQREVDYGWQTVQLAVLWLYDDPRRWLAYHARRPWTLWRLLRLVVCCLVVTLLAEPHDGREL